MKWPAWFPYPQSWFRAVLQILYLVPVVGIVARFAWVNHLVNRIVERSQERTEGEANA